MCVNFSYLNNKNALFTILQQRSPVMNLSYLVHHTLDMIILKHIFRVDSIFTIKCNTIVFSNINFGIYKQSLAKTI